MLRSALLILDSLSGLGRLLVERALRLGDDGAERLGLVHCDVSQHLAVQRDAGELQRVDELAVGETFGPDCSVDALDPQSTKAPLLHLAVAVGVLPCLLDSLASNADGVLAAAVIALCLLENAL